MALSVSEIARTVFGNKHVLIAEITFDSSYPTGGEALTAATLGLTAVEAFVPAGPAAAAAGAASAVVKYDRTNSKLQAFQSGPVAATVTIASHTHTENTDALYTQNATTGATVATGTVSTLAAAPLAEVANATNLATLKVVAFIVGS